MVREWTERK